MPTVWAVQHREQPQLRKDGFKISFMENNLMTRGTAVILIHPDDAEIVKQHYSNK